MRSTVHAAWSLLSLCDFVVTCFPTVSELFMMTSHTRRTRHSAGHVPRACPVFHPLFLPGLIPKQKIKSCNLKNQIWDSSRKKWYLSQSGCGIKCIWDKYHFFWDAGKQLWRWRRGQPRRTTQMFGPGRGVVGAWTLLRDVGTSARNRRVAEPTR